MASESWNKATPEENERAKRRSQRMAETDRLSDLATLEDKGIAEGILNGHERVAERMLSRGRPISEIQVMTDLTEDEIKAIAEHQQQFQETDKLSEEAAQEAREYEERLRKRSPEYAEAYWFGIRKGMIIGWGEVLQKMLSMNRSISEIQAMTDLTEEDIRLMTEIQQKFQYHNRPRTVYKFSMDELRTIRVNAIAQRRAEKMEEEEWLSEWAMHE